MLALAADENFNNDLVRRVLRRNPRLDIVRIQDVGLSGTGDKAVLEWAAREGRVLLTHDVSTLTRHAPDQSRPSHVRRVRSDPRRYLATAIEDILLLAELSHPGEWEGQILYLPL